MNYEIRFVISKLWLFEKKHSLPSHFYSPSVAAATCALHFRAVNHPEAGFTHFVTKNTVHCGFSLKGDAKRQLKH